MKKFIIFAFLAVALLVAGDALASKTGPVCSCGMIGELGLGSFYTTQGLNLTTFQTTPIYDFGALSSCAGGSPVTPIYAFQKSPACTLMTCEKTVIDNYQGAPMYIYEGNPPVPPRGDYPRIYTHAFTRVGLPTNTVLAAGKVIDLRSPSMATPSFCNFSLNEMKLAVTLYYNRGNYTAVGDPVGCVPLVLGLNLLEIGPSPNAQTMNFLFKGYITGDTSVGVEITGFAYGQLPTGGPFGGTAHCSGTVTPPAGYLLLDFNWTVTYMVFELYNVLAGDINNDGRVNLGDYGLLSANYNKNYSADPLKTQFCGCGQYF